MMCAACTALTKITPALVPGQSSILLFFSFDAVGIQTCAFSFVIDVDRETGNALRRTCIHRSTLT
jgi:hypothetical protein